MVRLCRVGVYLRNKLGGRIVRSFRFCLIFLSELLIEIPFCFDPSFAWCWGKGV